VAGEASTGVAVPAIDGRAARLAASTPLSPVATITYGDYRLDIYRRSVTRHEVKKGNPLSVPGGVPHAAPVNERPVNG
jgi:hypothetical protein